MAVANLILATTLGRKSYTLYIHCHIERVWTLDCKIIEFECSKLKLSQFSCTRVALGDISVLILQEETRKPCFI